MATGSIPICVTTTRIGWARSNIPALNTMIIVKGVFFCDELNPE